MKTRTLIISLCTAVICMHTGTACADEETLPLPEVETYFKTYMDYRKITDRDSLQYRLQQDAYTDSMGIRRIDGDVCVALGTAYASRCGERFDITLDSGHSFRAVAADIKADCDTDPTNRYVELSDGSGDMVEFIVDTKSLDRRVRLMGSIGAYEQYSGSVVSIIPVE